VSTLHDRWLASPEGQVARGALLASVAAATSGPTADVWAYERVRAIYNNTRDAWMAEHKGEET